MNLANVINRKSVKDRIILDNPYLFAPIGQIRGNKGLRDVTVLLHPITYETARRESSGWRI